MRPAQLKKFKHNNTCRLCCLLTGHGFAEPALTSLLRMADAFHVPTQNKWIWLNVFKLYDHKFIICRMEVILLGRVSFDTSRKLSTSEADDRLLITLMCIRFFTFAGNLKAYLYQLLSFKLCSAIGIDRLAYVRLFPACLAALIYLQAISDLTRLDSTRMQGLGPVIASRTAQKSAGALIAASSSAWADPQQQHLAACFKAVDNTCREM